MTVGESVSGTLGIRGWIRWGFLLWAVVSTAWLANSMRTRGVTESVLRNSPAVHADDKKATLEFVTTASDAGTALIFICGSGVSAEAYAPLLRPLAEAGFPVFVIKLPLRFAPLESHKQSAMQRVDSVISAHPEVSAWVVAGHSLGGALAARFTQSAPDRISAMVLIGTTHPKETDLSSLAIPVTKVYASNDGVAPPARVLANRHLLPTHTTWVEIRGGNHSQFGHYGTQLLDGKATISRETQQTMTRSALLDALKRAASGTSLSSSMCGTQKLLASLAVQLKERRPITRTGDDHARPTSSAPQDSLLRH